MKLRLDESRPIYQQIIEEFKRSIARGEIKVGERIPSQRELAEMIRVNPNTVQRAYREMEHSGLVETLRGQGTFVRDDPELMDSMRKEMAQAALLGFAQEMVGLGFSPEEVQAMVVERSLWEKVGEPSDGHR